MKRLLAILLVVLMAMPFALLASAADAPPAEPTVKADAKKLYLTGAATNGTGDGSSPANGAKCTGWDPAKAEGDGKDEASIAYKIHEGAYCIIETKGYVGAAKAVIKAKAPVLFTALDPADGVSNIAKNPDGSYNVDSDSDGIAQVGMFMKDTNPTDEEKSTLFIQSAVIFENIVILNRKSAPGIYRVENGGSLVIKDTCDFAFGSAGTENVKLVVDEGGYAYLHNVGFSSITGKGTIVLDKALVTAGKVTKATFEGFEGKIVAQDGTDPFTAPDLGPIPTGDMTWVVAAVASIAVMGTAVVVSKKRA